MEDTIYEFAYLGNEAARFAQLARLSAEDWSFDTDDQGISRALRQYVEMRFDLARRQERIRFIDGDTPAACFNSGLRTNSGEAILLLFVGNRYPNRQPFHWRGSFPESHGVLRQFADLPPAAQAWSTVSDLAFDPDLEWRADFEHMRSEANVQRLPESIRNLPASTLDSVLRGVLEKTHLLCRGRVTVVAPEFHAGRIGFFVPAPLLHWTAADHVFALEACSAHYRVATLLPKAWAYARARIIGVTPEWMRHEHRTVRAA